MKHITRSEKGGMATTGSQNYAEAHVATQNMKYQVFRWLIPIDTFVEIQQKCIIYNNSRQITAEQ